MKGKNRELTKIQSISRAVRTRQRESARTREGGRERECRRAKSTGGSEGSKEDFRERYISESRTEYQFFKIRSKKKREGSIAKEIADCAHSGISVTTSPASM